jgi:hypothetical protein
MKDSLAAIAATFPNGFHDAFLRRLVLDFAEQRATLTLNVWVGDLDAKTEAEREAYRFVTIDIMGLLWCITEPPDAGARHDGKGLWIDAGPVSTLKEKPRLPAVPDDAFVWWIFIRDWNGFIYIGGTDARLVD